MPKATQEEIDLLAANFPKFVQETRDNFSDVNKSLNSFEEKLDDIYKMLGKNGTETHLLASNVNKATDKIGKHTDKIEQTSQKLQQEIKSSTKVIIQETDAIKKRWWQVWIKKSKNKE
jgi:methyl-accepting chemotaxis protein